jgi:predicted DNA-binding WGR domain protein
LKTLTEFLEERWRDDDKSAAWHVGAIGEMWEALTAVGLDKQARDIKVSVGPPATAREVAAYQALTPVALPAELAEAWRAVGGTSFSSRDGSFRWLGPAEIVARRDELRARIRKSVRKYHPEIDVLAVANEEPLLLFDPRQVAIPQNKDGTYDVWYHMADGEPYSVLGWLIAVHINLLVKREIEARIGDVFRLAMGQRPGKTTERVRWVKANRYWEAIRDERQLLTRSAKIGAAGKPSVKVFATADDAAKQLAKLMKAAKAKGYRP